MLQTLNHAFSPLKQIGSLQYRNGVRSYTQMLHSSTTVFILLGNGSVTAITGNLSIYNYKMYIFNDNGFLQLSCLKDTHHPPRPALITTLRMRAPGQATRRGVFVLVNGGGLAAFQLHGDEALLIDPPPLLGRAVMQPQEVGPSVL